jgi:MGT family glycosyltransferase
LRPLGTQSLRNPQAGCVLSRVLEAVSRRNDWFVVIACHPTQAAALPTDVDNALVVHQAPQLGMLRRASVFVTHAGFNGLKEAVACGVPMVAVPLSHDQPRNAALVVYRGLGLALHAPTLTAAAVATAVDHVMSDASIRAACHRLRRTFRETSGYDRALSAIDSLMAEGPPRLQSSGAMRGLGGDATRPFHGLPGARWSRPGSGPPVARSV